MNTSTDNTPSNAAARLAAYRAAGRATGRVASMLDEAVDRHYPGAADRGIARLRAVDLLLAAGRLALAPGATGDLELGIPEVPRSAFSAPGLSTTTGYLAGDATWRQLPPTHRALDAAIAREKQAQSPVYDAIALRASQGSPGALGQPAHEATALRVACEYLMREGTIRAAIAPSGEVSLSLVRA